MEDSNSIIFTSCNGEYIDKFLKSYAASASYVGIKNKFIIDVVDHTETSKKIIEEVSSMFNNFYFVEDNNFPFDITWDKKTYYACRRFLLLPELLKKYNNIWITDIDMIFLRPLERINADIGYSKNNLDSNKFDDRKIKADLFFCNINFLNNANDIKNYILESKKEWFLDQLALWAILKDIKDYQELPSNVYNRKELLTTKIDAYGISPGGIHKRKKTFLKEIEFYNQVYKND
jgi:hypothetical protein